MLDVDLTAEIPQSANEPPDGLGLVTAGEMIGAKIAVGHAVAQHVVARPEHGGGDGEDGLLGAAAGFEAEELRLEIAALGVHGGPGGRDEGGFEPGGTIARAGRAALPGTLVAAGAEARPGDQVGGAGEA